MPDETGDRERKVAVGAAIGMAARRGMFGGGSGGSGGLGAGAGRAGGHDNDRGSPFLTAIIVCVVLFGMLGVMFYFNQ